MYGLTLTSAPAEEPVTTAELKAWLRQEETADDALIASLGAAARELVERLTGRQLVTASYRMTLDYFPWPGGWQYLEAPAVFPDPHTIRMPKAPLQSVASVQYYDLGNNLLTLAATVYDVDAASDPGRVVLGMNQVWPVVRLKPGAVRVAFTAGYGAAADVPEGLKHAVKVATAWLYENRGEAFDATNARLPLAVEALMFSHWNGCLEYSF